MPNSAGQINDYNPEEVIDFNTFYNNYGNEKYDGHWTDLPADHWLTKIANWFTGDLDTAKRKYEAYLSNVNIRNEQKATQSARAYDEFMSSTAYSRAFEDLQRAGVNPYLLLNGGSVASTTGSTSPKASYPKASMRDEKPKDQKGRDFALILLAIARLIASL